MAGQAPDWHLYRAFLGVLREGSLSGAARALGLTQPTVGRQIATLETLLATPLFARSQTGLVPTPLARDLVPHAEAMALSADALVRAASGRADEASGVVRIAASEFVGSLVLPAMLARLREIHPGIAIELSLSNRNEDLLRNQADIAVRMARPTQSALVARKIGRVSVGLFAHRDYLRRHGEPAALEDVVASHALIGFDRDEIAIGALRQTGLPIGREIFALRTDSDVAQFHALKAGFGIGGCQIALAAREPGLERVLPDAFKFDMTMWLVMHEDLRATLRMRIVFDFLVAALGDYLAWDKAGNKVRRGGQGGNDVLYPRTFRGQPRKKKRRVVTRGGAAR
jgi:DNA-binding transcriptional LysR family regulator